MRASYIVFNALKHLADGRVFISPRPESADQTVPYITHQMISRVPINTLDGYTQHDRVRVQIDVYAQTYSDAELLMHRVKMSINNASGAPIIDAEQSAYEYDAKLHRVTVDVFLSETMDHD
jgi:hypothetical protein